MVQSTPNREGPGLVAVRPSIFATGSSSDVGRSTSAGEAMDAGADGVNVNVMLMLL